jgi:hypothetical protein
MCLLRSGTYTFDKMTYTVMAFFALAVGCLGS